MSEQSMVERVARALHETLSKTDPSWDCYALARIAIEAMREPTQAMIRAGEDKTPECRCDVDRTFSAMIDAALGKETA